MTTAIIVIFILATIHYFYEGIYAPSKRMELRNELFKLRDELRSHRQHAERTDMRAFKVVSEAINVYLSRLPHINFHFLYRLKTAEAEDKQMTKEMKKRQDAVLSTNDEKIKEIFYRSSDVLRRAFIVNSGAWFIYLIPLAMFVISIRKVKEWAVNMFVTPAKNVNVLDTYPRKHA